MHATCFGKTKNYATKQPQYVKIADKTLYNNLVDRMAALIVFSQAPDYVEMCQGRI